MSTTHPSASESFDVVVIGGGPGGSSLAAFVAMQGHRVLLLERETFPRHQVGESLLPTTVHGICRLLGVGDELAAMNFPTKLGASFRWGKNEKPWRFEFSGSPVLEAAGATYAYQVERARFDALLLDNARRRGVDVRERCAVERVLRDDDGRVCGATYRDAGGARRTANARFVVDASGHQSRTYRVVGERLYSKFFQNVALYGYYAGGKRLPPPNAGNILCAAFGEGWFWYIPLSDTLTSVGVVVGKEHAERLASGDDAAMDRFVAACPLVKDYLAGAERVTTGEYGRLRVRKDFSYTNTRYWAPGCVLVGDAACFVDPVFSSGVHLATYSALLAARSINTCLADDAVDEARVFDEFERRYRMEYMNFYKFCLVFYDMNRDESSYFWAASSLVDARDREEAFIRLVAGGSSAPNEFFSSGAALEESLVWSDEATRRVVPPGRAGAAPARRPRNHGREDVFTDHADEAPLFDGGLVPTADQLRWRAPKVA